MLLIRLFKKSNFMYKDSNLIYTINTCKSLKNLLIFSNLSLIVLYAKTHRKILKFYLAYIFINFIVKI